MIKLEKISFKTLKKMNVRDRINAIQDPRLGPTLAAALTPTEISMLFPRYYLEGMPDVSGFMKAIPSAATQARQQFYDEQIKNTVSGTPRPLAGKAGGWMEKFREKMTTSTAKKPTLTTEQDDVIKQIRAGQISADDPKAAFLKKIPAEKLKEYRIEEVADDKGNKVYKNIPLEISREDAEKRIREDSSVIGKHAALKALIAKKEHGVEGDGAYDVIYRFGKGVMNPPKPVSEMTIAEILAFQHEAKARAGSDAFPVGKYQFTETTLRRLTNNNHLDPNTTTLSKEVQEKFGNQLIENRGGNPEGLMSEWDGLKRFSNKDEITGAMEVDKNSPATDAKLPVDEKIAKVKEQIQKETDQKISSAMASYLNAVQPTATPVKAGQFPDWVTDRSKREMSALNSEFVQDLLEASRRSGIKFNVTQGMRSAEEAAKNAASGRGVRNSQHLFGAAADIKILDENGNPVGHERRDLYQKFATAYESSSKERGGQGRWLGNSKTWSHDIWHFDQGLDYGQTHKRNPYGELKPTADDVRETLKETSPAKHPFGEVAVKAKEQELKPTQPPTVEQPKSEPKTNEAIKTEPAKPSEPPKVEPKPNEPPKEAPIEAKTVKSIPVKARGGDVDLSGETKLEAKPIESLKGDNTVVVDQNSTPKFTMNTEKEAAVYDPEQRRVDVIPSQKVNGGLDAVNQTGPDLISELDSLAENLRKEFITMISDQDKEKPRPVTNTMTDRDPNMIENLGHFTPTPSATRAFSRTRFVETGDAKDDFHHSLGTSSLS